MIRTRRQTTANDDCHYPTSPRGRFLPAKPDQKRAAPAHGGLLFGDALAGHVDNKGDLVPVKGLHQSKGTFTLFERSLFCE